MEELIFVLFVIFVAYVFFNSGNEKKAEPKSADLKNTAETVDVVIDVKPATSEPVKKTSIIKPKVIKKAAPRVVEPKVEASKEVSEKPAIKAPVKTGAKKGLKNPLTGEIATTYNNYRFTKRWIKDALVTEGLLEQIYKNAELTEAVEANIKVAISQLEALDNYKP